MSSYWTGLGKAPVFAVIIALVGCYRGFQVGRQRRERRRADDDERRAVDLPGDRDRCAVLDRLHLARSVMPTTRADPSSDAGHRRPRHLHALRRRGRARERRACACARARCSRWSAAAARASPRCCARSSLLQQPASGSIRVFGQEVVGLGDEEALPLRRRWGVMFERGALFSSLTVAENVGMVLARAHRSAAAPDPRDRRGEDRTDRTARRRRRQVSERAVRRHAQARVARARARARPRAAVPRRADRGARSAVAPAASTSWCAACATGSA